MPDGLFTAGSDHRSFDPFTLATSIAMEESGHLSAQGKKRLQSAGAALLTATDDIVAV
jgi:hypothetical protein